MVGADVEELYPSLTDIEIAGICYEAVMALKVKFETINYQRAGMYVAMNMFKAARDCHHCGGYCLGETAKVWSDQE